MSFWLLMEGLPEARVNEVANVADDGCMQALKGRPQAAALLVTASEEGVEGCASDQVCHFRHRARQLLHSLQKPIVPVLGSRKSSLLHALACFTYMHIFATGMQLHLRSPLQQRISMMMQALPCQFTRSSCQLV